MQAYITHFGGTFLNDLSCYRML